MVPNTIYTLNFALSAIPPQAIARDTAANAIWNKNINVSEILISLRPLNEPIEPSPPNKNPVVPQKLLPSPNAKPNPSVHQATTAILNVRTVLPATWPAFFIRTVPASKSANPACMKNTSIAAKNTKSEFSPISNTAGVTSPSAAKADTGKANIAAVPNNP
ncbi:hypothetical protein D3C81_1142250 [compost metagenome]